MKLRPATIEDADLLLEWRNDPATRANSRNTELVERDGHIAWLNRRIADGTAPLIAEIDGIPVGTVRLDKGPEGVELSWTVAPIYRGNGAAKRMVAEALALIDGTVIADIRPGNIASQKVAQANGFKHVATSGDLQRWIRHLIASCHTRC